MLMDDCSRTMQRDTLAVVGISTLGMPSDRIELVSDSGGTVHVSHQLLTTDSANRWSCAALCSTSSDSHECNRRDAMEQIVRKRVCSSSMHSFTRLSPKLPFVFENISSVLQDVFSWAMLAHMFAASLARCINRLPWL
jgi:hypothetical protein